MANAVLFVAPVLLFAVRLDASCWDCSSAVELSMFVVALQDAVTLLGRSCDTDDWLSNVIGAGTGALVGVAVLGSINGRRAPRRRTVRSAQSAATDTLRTPVTQRASEVVGPRGSTTLSVHFDDGSVGRQWAILVATHSQRLSCVVTTG